MNLISSLGILFVSVLPCFAQNGTFKVYYNTFYDDATWSLDDTACSNGVNGLESKWPVLGDVPGFPKVGGVPGLVWNSTLCGTCWQLTYAASDGTLVNTTIVGVDAATGAFDIAENAMSAWVGSVGINAGSVMATAVQVAPSVCGISG